MPRTLSLSFELLGNSGCADMRGEKAPAAMSAGDQPAQPVEAAQVPPARGTAVGPAVAVRNGKTWELTDEGRRVWPAVAELVDRYDNLETFLHGDRSLASSLRFSCGQLMAAGLVRDALGPFHREHPQTMLRISTLRGRCADRGC